MAESKVKTKKQTAEVKSVKKASTKNNITKPSKITESNSKTVKTPTAKTLKGKTSKVTKGTAKGKLNVIDVSYDLIMKTNGKIMSKTYLKDKDLNYFKVLLIEQKTEILENARKLRESIVDENTGEYVGDNSTFSMHMAEQGSDEMERQKAYMLIQRDEKHLFYLEKALERIAKKTYGLCVSCGKHISKARLEAVPITSHCINCKQNFSG